MNYFPYIVFKFVSLDQLNNDIDCRYLRIILHGLVLSGYGKRFLVDRLNMSWVWDVVGSEFYCIGFSQRKAAF